MNIATVDGLGAVVHRFSEIGSTNAYLLNLLQGADQLPCWQVCIADHQTAGRGRRGRAWVDAPGQGIAVSVGGNVPNTDAVGLLSIRSGLSVVSAFSSLVSDWVPAVSLKWPNDLYVGNSKLGGILVETLVRSEQLLSVVVGVGINLGQAPYLSDGGRNTPVAIDMHQLGMSRDAFAELIAQGLLEVLALRGGLEIEELAAWRRSDMLYARRVRVAVSGDDVCEGVAMGINDQGMLKVTANDDTERYLSAGDVEFTRLR